MNTRICILFTMIVGALLSTGLATAQDPSSESNAIEKLRELKGMIEKDDDLPGSPAAGVYLTRNSFYSGIPSVGDKHLELLPHVKNLAIVDLGFCSRVTDRGMKELGVLKNLSALNLRRTYISDAGLRELRALKNLAYLDLAFTKITDAGLKELGEFENLVCLDLSDTRLCFESHLGLNLPM